MTKETLTLSTIIFVFTIYLTITILKEIYNIVYLKKQTKGLYIHIKQ